MVVSPLLLLCLSPCPSPPSPSSPSSSYRRRAERQGRCRHCCTSRCARPPHRHSRRRPHRCPPRCCCCPHCPRCPCHLLLHPPCPCPVVVVFVSLWHSLWASRRHHRCVDAGQGGGVAIAVVPLVIPVPLVVIPLAVPLVVVPVLLIVLLSSPSSSPLSLSPLSSSSSSCRRSIGHGLRVVVVAVSTQGRVTVVVLSLCVLQWVVVAIDTGGGGWCHPHRSGGRWSRWPRWSRCGDGGGGWCRPHCSGGRRWWWLRWLVSSPLVMVVT